MVEAAIVPRQVFVQLAGIAELYHHSFDHDDRRRDIHRSQVGLDLGQHLAGCSDDHRVLLRVDVQVAYQEVGQEAGGFTGLQIGDGERRGSTAVVGRQIALLQHPLAEHLHITDARQGQPVACSQALQQHLGRGVHHVQADVTLDRIVDSSVDPTGTSNSGDHLVYVRPNRADSHETLLAALYADPALFGPSGGDGTSAERRCGRCPRTAGTPSICAAPSPTFTAVAGRRRSTRHGGDDEGLQVRTDGCAYLRPLHQLYRHRHSDALSSLRRYRKLDIADRMAVKLPEGIIQLQACVVEGIGQSGATIACTAVLVLETAVSSDRNLHPVGQLTDVHAGDIAVRLSPQRAYRPDQQAECNCSPDVPTDLSP